MPAAWSDPRVWGGKQLGKSLGGFFPSWESSLKPRPARPRSQVSFERSKPRHGQGERAACSGCQGTGSQKGDLLQDFATVWCPELWKLACYQSFSLKKQYL